MEAKGRARLVAGALVVALAVATAWWWRRHRR